MDVILLHAAATLFMTGVIWFVQIVHYPLFDRVGVDETAEYARRHSRLTSLVVGPPMVLEAGTAFLLLFRHPGEPAVGIGAGLLLLIWISTFLWQVPCHERLGRGHDRAAHAHLVRTNWVRTVAWSIRSVLALSPRLSRTIPVSCGDRR